MDRTADDLRPLRRAEQSRESCLRLSALRRLPILADLDCHDCGASQERASWAKPEALTDSAIEAITLAHANQRRAVKELARYQKFTMRSTRDQEPRYQKR